MKRTKTIAKYNTTDEKIPLFPVLNNNTSSRIFDCPNHSVRSPVWHGGVSRDSLPLRPAIIHKALQDLWH